MCHFKKSTVCVRLEINRFTWTKDMHLSQYSSMKTCCCANGMPHAYPQATRFPCYEVPIFRMAHPDFLLVSLQPLSTVSAIPFYREDDVRKKTSIPGKKSSCTMTTRRVVAGRYGRKPCRDKTLRVKRLIPSYVHPGIRLRLFQSKII